MALPVTRTVVAWPAVPVNVITPFWPGVEIDTGTAAPLTLVEPDTSAGTLYRLTVRFPTASSVGLTKTVYAPVAGSVTGSMKPETSIQVEEPDTDVFEDVRMSTQTSQ